MTCKMLDMIDDDLTSTDDESEDYSEDVAKIDNYRENISKNPNDYDSHFRLIKALKYSEKLLEARDSRESMNKHYPLSPDLWLEWIEDEKSLNSNKDFIDSLFRRAHADYRSVDLWFEYCQFSCGYLSDRDAIRQIFAEAIDQVGTQIARAYLVWGTWIMYENSVLIQCQNNGPDEIESQKERIYGIYRRQLSIPLEGNGDTFSEFLEFTDNRDWIEEITEKFQESQKKLERFRPFEERLDRSTVDYSANKTESEEAESREDVWLGYLAFAEEEIESKLEVVSVYERAITDLCLSQSIWMKYLQFLTRSFDYSEPERVMAAYKRAVRNYKSSLELWIDCARYSEKCRRPLEDTRDIFHAIFAQNLIDDNPFLPLWTAYLDFEKRILDNQSTPDLTQIRSIFDRLTSIENYVAYDPRCSLIKYWAFIEAKYGQNLEKGRELWTLIRQSIGGSESSLWMEIFEFERRFGDREHLKRAMTSAVNCHAIDYPQYLFERVLRIASEDGDLDTFMQLKRKIDVQNRKIAERTAKEEAEKNDKSNKNWKDSANKKRKSLKEQPRKQEEKKEKVDSKNQKRKAEIDSQPVGPKSKQVSNDCDLNEPVKSTHVVESMKEGPVEHCNEKTVFVSNLNFRVTENDLREKFEKCGKLIEIRMATDSSDRFRGFAYIQFENTDDVENALKLEHNLLMGRPMFVNRSNPEKRHSFQFPVGVTEKTKLFVKNLPKTVSKYALENVFKPFGALKEVRIVTFKNGAPKGYAYVEFLNEDDASKALVGTDGLKIGDNLIEVLLSKPPSKTSSEKEAPSKEPVETKPSCFIVPRAVQKPVMTQKKLIHGTSSKNEEITEPKKSNDDFRKFLL